jgi:hypothetical protein
MVEKPEWTTDDFKNLSWHDCHFYGFTLERGDRDDGTAQLTFDLDFIVEWLCDSGPPYRWRVAPAVLVFHDVCGLRIELDYATVGAGMTPFTIDGIEREAHPHSRQTFRWRLPINWPSGVITFESPGFTQSLRAAPILVDRQSLHPLER